MKRSRRKAYKLWQVLFFLAAYWTGALATRDWSIWLIVGLIMLLAFLIILSIGGMAISIDKEEQ